MIAGRSLRLVDALLILVAFGLAGGLYLLGVLSISLTLKPLVAVIACLAFGQYAPKSALATSLALPFLGQLPAAAIISSQAENLGSALCVGVLLRSLGRQHAEAGRRSRALVLAFGVVNLIVLVELPHGDASATSLVQAMVHAVITAAAATVVTMDVAVLARVAAPAGVVLSWVAYSTPQLLVDRSTSTAGQNANGVGMVAAICLVLAVVGILRDTLRWKSIHVAAAVVCGAGVFVSQSRGAYLDLAVAALVVASGRLLTRRTIAGWMGLGLFVGLATWVGILVVSWAGTFTGRFSAAQAETESLQSRKDAAVYSLQMGLLHPLDGVGLTNLANFSSLNEGDTLVRSHIVYLGIWGEVGLVAAVLFGAICWRAVVNARPEGRHALGVIAAVLVAGVSVNWWPLSGAGTIALAVLTWGASLQVPIGKLPAPTRPRLSAPAADARYLQQYREGSRQ